MSQRRGGFPPTPTGRGGLPALPQLTVQQRQALGQLAQRQAEVVTRTAQRDAVENIVNQLTEPARVANEQAWRDFEVASRAHLTSQQSWELYNYADSCQTEYDRQWSNTCIEQGLPAAEQALNTAIFLQDQAKDQATRVGWECQQHT